MAESGNKLRKVSLINLKGLKEVGETLREPGNGKTGRSTKIPSVSFSDKLSRSHDNLTSTLRKRGVQISNAVGKKLVGKDQRVTGHMEPLTPGRTTKLRLNSKGSVTPTIRKSDSTQNLGERRNITAASLRAQSVQNICRIPLPIGTKGLKTPLVRKRSSSASNMINNGSQRSVRPLQSSAVAYNAELLSNFEKEKKSLERRISELIQVSENRKAETEKLKFEIKKITHDTNSAIEILRSENRQLKEQLNEHGITISHFTDNDKILLLEHLSSENLNSLDIPNDESVEMLHAGSEGADSLNLNRSLGRLSLGNLSSLATRNPSLQSIEFSGLDRQNSVSVESGLSEIGLAYLRDRILQMQETHYSTNEELQATLQELADLQDNVNELSAENEKLFDEKSILLESLCTQTEKLENARLQIEHMKVLLIQDCDNNDRTENERQLVSLIKSAQEEREELLLKQAELNNALTALQNENREVQDIVSVLRDRAELEESKSKVFQNDKRMLESQICDMKNQLVTDQLEIAKYKALLENERQKFTKTEVEVSSENRMDDLVAQVSREKDELKDQLAVSKQELTDVKNELLKVTQVNGSLNDALQIAQTNMRMQTKKLESKIEEMEIEKLKLVRKTEIMENDLSVSQGQHKQMMDENQSLAKKLLQLESELTLSKKLADDLKKSLHEQTVQFKEEQENWLQFQKDFQVAIVIANDLKTEMEYSVENINTENQILKDKLSTMSKDLASVKSERDLLRQKELTDSSPASSSLAAGRLAALRQGRLNGECSKSTDSLVKKIISDELVKVENPLSSPASPSCNDHFFRTQDTKSETVLTTAATTPSISVESNSAVASGTGNNQLPPATDSVSVSPHVNASEFKHDKVPDLDSLDLSEAAGLKTVSGEMSKKPLVGILANKMQLRKGLLASENYEKNLLEKTMLSGSGTLHTTKTDPLASLAKQLGGSKRNALLRWCQNKMAAYPGIDITNFSSSWNDGLAFCALLHSYIPDKIPFKDLSSQDRMSNFKCAFDAAESIGISTGPDTNVLIVTERPDWQAVFSYVTSIYKHFEVDAKL